jgi:hypothetical protein
MQNFHSAVSDASMAISCLVSSAIAEAYGGTAFTNIESAQKDAAISVKWLAENGHSAVIGSMMESIENCSWWASPEEDMDTHCALVHKVFDAAIDAAGDLEEEESEEVNTSEDALHLEKCLQMT